MASVTVYISLPNQQLPGVGLSLARYFWLGLTDSNGQTAYYGYYPIIDKQGKMIYQYIPGNLHVNDNEAFNYSDSVTFQLNETQYSNINEHIYFTELNPPPYIGLGNSSINFIYRVLAQAGIYPNTLSDGNSLSHIPLFNAPVLHASDIRNDSPASDHPAKSEHRCFKRKLYPPETR